MIQFFVHARITYMRLRRLWTMVIHHCLFGGEWSATMLKNVVVNLTQPLRLPKREMLDFKASRMVPLIGIGKRRASTTVGIRDFCLSTRTQVVMLVIGALIPVGAVVTDLCEVAPELAYISAGIIGLAAFGVARGWPWARLVSRIAIWLDIILFSMLIVPDPEDAIPRGEQGLHFTCGAIAGYFLVCAIVLGVKKRV
jgi:hypothetical protein